MHTMYDGHPLLYNYIFVNFKKNIANISFQTHVLYLHNKGTIVICV